MWLALCRARRRVADPRLMFAMAVTPGQALPSGVLTKNVACSLRAIDSCQLDRELTGAAPRAGERPTPVGGGVRTRVMLDVQDRESFGELPTRRSGGRGWRVGSWRSLPDMTCEPRK